MYVTYVCMYFYMYVFLKALIEYVLRSDEILDCDEALLFEAATRQRT